MEFLDSLIVVSPPRADHVLIAKYIIIAISLFFIPYFSILFGSVIFSLGFSYRGKREDNSLFTQFSRDLMDTLTGNIGIALILGILPILTLAICFSQILYGASVHIQQYFFVTLILVAASLVLMFLYKGSFANRENSFDLHLGLGVLAILVMTVAIFAFVSTVTVVTFPEKWPLINTAIPLTFDWNMVARFVQFILAALALTGAAILFFFFNWMGGKEDLTPKYRGYIRKFGGGISLGFLLLQSLFFLWYVGTIPIMAKSYAVFYSGIAAVLVLLIASYHLYYLLRNSKIQYGSRIFVLFIVFFLIVSLNENYARENALLYQNYALEKVSRELVAEIEANREERSGAAQASVELGEQIFNQKCSACHQFNQRVVGPPYNEVLPKYEGNVEKLKNFIMNPVKVNPDYIAMPDQGLKPYEAESAAMYLLQHYQELKNQ